MSSRSLVAVLLSASLILATGRARAEGSEPANPAGVVWRGMAVGGTALRPLVAAGPIAVDAPFAPRAILVPRLAPPTPQAILSKEEKVVIIVAAVVIGVILLFVTVKIGSHNGPFS
jgi:hypothetical protein